MKCKAITGKGHQCTYSAKDSGYCGRHKNYEKKEHKSDIVLHNKDLVSMIQKMAGASSQLHATNRILRSILPKSSSCPFPRTEEDAAYCIAHPVLSLTRLFNYLQKHVPFIAQAMKLLESTPPILSIDVKYLEGAYELMSRGYNKSWLDDEHKIHFASSWNHNPNIVVKGKSLWPKPFPKPSRIRNAHWVIRLICAAVNESRNDFDRVLQAEYVLPHKVHITVKSPN